MAKKQNYRTISYQYYCKECSKTFNWVLDFDDRLKKYACPCCENLLKYKGGHDISVTTNGNCGYISASKCSEQNIKRIGTEKYEQMCNEDPVVQKKMAEKNSPAPWYGKLPDGVTNTKRYIETGEKQ